MFVYCNEFLTYEYFVLNKTFAAAILAMVVFPERGQGMSDFHDPEKAAERLSAATANLTNPRDAAIAQQYCDELRMRALEKRLQKRRVALRKLEHSPEPPEP